jgi:3-dehydroquinate synthase
MSSCGEVAVAMDSSFRNSKIYFKNELPPMAIFGSSAILIYDRIFDRNVITKSWVKKFPRRFSVRSGEALKDIGEFSNHLKKVVKLSEGLSTKQINIVVLGGGSVGDFAGFVASILKRGVRLTQMPSTWLAAIDSAHGGKNGLNVSKIKNQVGTFYPAHDIFLIKNLLRTQPLDRAFEAFGEVSKISLLEGRGLWTLVRDMDEINSETYWRILPKLIAAKNKIVKSDPFERRGQRHLLNLGHTVGHVWESQLKIPHGIAVLFGLAFAIEWSRERGVMSSKNYYEIRLSEMGSYLPDRFDLKKILRRTKKSKRFLLQDKKISKSGKIRFIFLSAPGVPRIKEIEVTELIREMARQSR